MVTTDNCVAGTECWKNFPFLFNYFYAGKWEVGQKVHVETDMFKEKYKHRQMGALIQE